jgi:D-inositol-3-phosphate glycosyltransferase
VVHVPAGPESHVGPAEIYPYLPQFVDGVRRFAAESGLHYDVIFSHYWLSGWAAHELRAQWGVPVVQMFHTLGRMKNRIAQQVHDREGDIRIFTETDIMSWADRLVAATPAERAQMLWLYRADRRKIDIVPPGVDLERFRPLPPDDAKGHIGVLGHHRMLLFVGRIEPLKGVDTLLRAVAILRDQNPTLLEDLCVCVIGGDPEDEPPDAEMVRLRSLREELNLRDRVTFLGARDQDMLHYYYSAAEMLIMPSDYESFGMVALEAMACGTPVIASEVGGLAFLVQDGETGFHVPNQEPEALADAHQLAQEYGWPQIGDRLLDVFERAKRKNAGITAVMIE